MNSYTEIIEKYLSGGMNAIEKAEFEKQLSENSELKTELFVQQQVIKGIERAHLTTQISKGFKVGSFKSKVIKWSIGIVIAVVVSTTAYVVMSKNSEQSNNIHFELNEENTKNWSEADRQTKSQFYQVNGSRDTILETEGGIILQIPAGAFLNATGDDVTNDYEIEIKEATTPLEIMRAGLTTISNGKLLETGGMFYINARQNGKNLIIPANKTIHASIPNRQPGKQMMLFDGQRMPNGDINWIRPKNMETHLTHVDILKLNFYPPNFLDTLKSLGFDPTNKTLTDSIYFSFTCSGTLPAAQEVTSDSIRRRKDTMRSASGKDLFLKNCSVCHSTGSQKLTGPGMEGVLSRVPGRDWLSNFILNSEKMIKSGDVYANKIYRENGKAQMTVFEGQLSEEDVSAIIKYLGGKEIEIEHNTGSSSCEIAPARIHAIWDKKFNNTILATKEFEARLKEIFRTCNQSLLDLYVRNLDKKLYELDSIAMIMTESEIFRDFYKKRHGGIQVNSEQLQKLYSYMDEKRTIYDSIARITLKKLYEQEHIADKIALDESNNYVSKESQRVAKLLSEELELNMKEAYRQLGKTYKPTVPTTSYYGTTISSTGWKNVDAFVLEATVNRKDLNYTDAESGKKAKIDYKPFSVKVNNEKEFDRIVSYLIPKKLSTFQKMIRHPNGSFSEQLNELLNYDAVILAFKNDKIYIKKLAKIKPGNTIVKLQKISAEELENLGKFGEQRLEDEFNHQLFQRTSDLRHRKIREREEIKRRLLPIVFPCMPVPTTDYSESFDSQIYSQ